MKVLTCSRFFPKGHPKAGQPTYFVEKIWADLADKTDMTMGSFDMDFYFYYNCTMPKGHTIRAGERFKPGDMVSLRVWSEKPYRSKQIEFAQVEVKKVFDIYTDGVLWWINGQPAPSYVLTKVAANDGLTIEDFISWFAMHPKKQGRGFTGQIICWDDSIEYGKPAGLEREVAG